MFTNKNQLKDVKNAKNQTSSTSPDHPIGCCQPLAKASHHLPTSEECHSTAAACSTKKLAANKKEEGKTKITVKYDIGFSNQLFIRGKGANLSWEKGQPLKNVLPDEWTWETDTCFTQCEFKVLINDHIYENGNNHLLHSGSSFEYTPHFD